MPKLDIQPEDIDRLLGADFERCEPGYWWDTEDWHSQENNDNKIEFLREFQSITSTEISPDELTQLTAPDVSVFKFFNLLTDFASEAGFYVYNSDNYFEIYDADLIEDKYSPDELADMLEESTAVALPSPMH